MMAVMGPILGAVLSDAARPPDEIRRREAAAVQYDLQPRQMPLIIRFDPRVSRIGRSPSRDNGFAPGVFRNQPTYPTNQRDPRSPAWQFSPSHATLRRERRRAVNGKDPTFDAGFAVPGVGRNPEATGLLERSGHRDQSRLGSAR